MSGHNSRHPDDGGWKRAILAGLLGATVAVLPALCQSGYVIATVAGGGLPLTPSPATSVAISQPNVAADAYGNVYLTAFNCVFKMDASRVLTRVAGRSSFPGFSGDGGPAINAHFNTLQGVAVDGAGNVYLADYGNNRIRKITVATGIVTTVAGTGRSDYFGDGGPATSADLSQPWGVAVDGGGNLYIADGNNHRIRKVTSSTGIMTTVAGTGVQGLAGDGGPATSAQLFFPTGVAVDSVGNIFILDSGSPRIRGVAAATGIINPVAGNGTPGFAGDGGPATSAEFQSPIGLAVDGAGNLYIADSNGNRVRKVAAVTGIITTVAGNGTIGFVGDGGPATSASLYYPNAVAADVAGNLYIADGFNYRVRKVTAASGVITTVAGNGRRLGPASDGGPATNAQLFPNSVAADVFGNLYIVDNRRIRKVVLATGVITAVAGTGLEGDSGDGGPAANASLFNPQGVAVDGAGNLYIADTYNSRIRKVVMATGLITTVAGNGIPGYAGDGGLAVNAQIFYPQGVAVDKSGNLYLADTSNNRIRKVAATTNIITTVAGTGTAAYSGDGGPAANAQLNSPQGIATDGAGNVYIADSMNQRIREVVVSTGIITTVAGTGAVGPVGDGGPATSANLYSPRGVAVDGAANLYIADYYNNEIRKVASATGIITTIAGRFMSGYSGDGGPAASAQLNGPEGIATDGAGNVYVADLGNNVVRVLAPSGVSPLLTVAKSHAVNFSAGQSGAAYSVTVNNATGAGPTSGTVTVTDNVPAGMTLQSMSGIGWNCALAANTCTRTDALSGGSSYAPIAVSVNVASSPPAQAVNQVSVTGGGSVAATDSDMTPILTTPSQLAFTTSPSNTSVGVALSPLVVQVQDAFGNLATGLAAGSAPVTVTSSPAGVSTTVNAVNGVATFSNLVLNAAGTYTLSASSPGLSSATSISFTVTVLPTVVIDTPAPGTVFTAPATIAITGWAIDNISAVGTAISGVQVKVDGTVVGNGTYGVSRPDVCSAFPGRPGCPNVGYTYSLSTAGLGFGTHTVTVSATDRDGVPDTGTASVMFTLAKAPTAVSVTSSANPSTLGQNVTLTAAVALTGATGAVTFYDGTTPVGRKTLVNGQASLTTRLLPAGVRSITAYSNGINSAPLNQTVNALPAVGFQPAVSYTVGMLPTSAAYGDFNGDGKTDLVFADDSGGINVLLGNGDGSFQPAVFYAAGGAHLVVVGDFNGDGKSDVAVSNIAGTVSVLLGNGDGTFQLPLSFVGLSYSRSMAVGDFNRDGIADLAIVEGGTNKVSILLGRGDGTFQAGPVALTGAAYSLSLVVGDFNGDGNADLAVTNTVDDSISVLLGNGDGTFQSAVNYTVGAHPIFVASGDFNGDGNADLAVANLDSNTVSILLGNGNGTFRSAVNYPAPYNPDFIAVGDVNGDGKTDLIVGPGYTGVPGSLLLGNGDGTFQPLTAFGAGASASSMVLGDFNGDGRTDGAVTSWDSNTVSILLGSSGPSQLKVTTQPLSGAPGTAISAVVQVQDASGNVAMGSSAPVTVTSTPVGVSATVNAINGVASFGSLIFSAAGTYTLTATSPGLTPATSLAFGILGAPVVVIDTPAPGAALSSGVAIISGWAIDNTILVGSAIASVVVKVDGVGIGNASYGINRPDVCAAYPGRPNCPNVGYSYSLNTLVLSNGAHTISVSATDSDGTPDVGSASVTVTISNSTATLSLASSASPAVYGQPVTLTATVTPAAASGLVTFYDGTTLLGTRTLVNGQASLTTALLPSGVRSLKAYYGGGGSYSVASATYTLTVNTVPANGFLPAVNYYVVGASPMSLASGDFNGDGKADLAVVGNGSNTVGVLMNRGDGTFRAAVSYAVGNTPFSVAVGDFNGDGKADLVVSNYGDNTLAVLLGNGDGTFRAAVTYAVGNTPRSVVVGDFNGDGQADLAVANFSDTTVSILLGNGDGTFRNALTSAAGVMPSTLAVGDFNGDGKADLVVGNFPGLNVLLGNGDGTFRSPQTYNMGGFTPSVAVGDFNRDGKLDIAVCESPLGYVDVLLGNGDGTFRAAVKYSTASFPSDTGPYSVALADFNGDGIPDLVTANSTFGGSLFVGNGDGTFQPAVLYAAGDGAYALVVGDFSGDGRADLAVTHNNSNNVSILLGVTASPPSVVIDSPTAGASVSSGKVVISGWAVDNTSTAGSAIWSVLVSVDGMVGAPATYGISRPDVCAAFPGRPNCPNVGFSYLLDTSALTSGTHTIFVFANDNDNPLPDVGRASITITVSSVPPSVAIDSPLPGTVLSGAATISGWAIDNSVSVGTAISSVVIKVDGTVIGNATYGSSRPDVCTAYPGRPACPNVGFTFALDTTTLTPGPHTLTAVATDSDGTPDIGSRTVAIVVSAPPMVFIDSLAPGARVGGTVTVSGWAFDNATAISGVQVKVDGAVAGNATYGTARPDVCVVFPGRPGCPNVGFSYALNTSGLSAGMHTITVVATDTDGTPDMGTYAVTVTVSAGVPPPGV